MKTSMSNNKDTLDGINNRLHTAENIAEGIGIETIQNETQREKLLKNVEQNISELWNNFKLPDMFIIKVLEGNEKGVGRRKVFELMGKFFLTW